jgi:hypothetical protein
MIPMDTICPSSPEKVQAPEDTPERDIDPVTEANLIASAEAERAASFDCEDATLADSAEVIRVPEVTQEPKPLELLQQHLAERAVVLTPIEKTSITEESLPSEPGSLEEITKSNEEVVSPEKVHSPEPNKLPKEPITEPVDTTTPVAPQPPELQTAADDGGRNIPPVETLVAEDPDDDGDKHGEPHKEETSGEDKAGQPDPDVESEPTKSKQESAETGENEEDDVEEVSVAAVVNLAATENDEWTNPVLRRMVRRMRYHAEESKIERVSILSKSMDPPFRSPTNLTCMYQLAEELQPHFTEYDTLVCDDTSGRLPTLVYRKIINKARADAGLPPVKTFFVNGSNTNLWAHPIAKNFEAPAGRTLLLTEFMCSGKAALSMYHAFTRHNPEAAVDMATVGVYEDTIRKLRNQMKTDSKLFAGDVGPVVGLLLYTPGSVPHKGVSKSEEAVTASRQPKATYNAAAVARSRQQANQVADTFIELLEESPPRVLKSGWLGRVKDINDRFGGPK